MAGQYTDVSDAKLFQTIKAPIGVDTEGYRVSPWGLSFSFHSNTGLVARAGSRGAAAFAQAIPALEPVVLHNALHDLGVLRALDVHLREDQWTDTMVMAYLLGEEFVGLKKLAEKYLGKHRGSYRDVMGEANERIGRQWLECMLTEFPRWPGAKPPELEKKLRLIDRMLKKHDTDLAEWEKAGSSPYDPPAQLRTKWTSCTAREFFEDQEALCGPMPEATLDDLPPEDAIDYAGEDADDTVTLYPVLHKRIVDLDLEDVLRVDLGIIPMLDRMHTIGIATEPGYFEGLKGYFQGEWDNWQKDLNEFAGFECNVKSTIDVPRLLQEKGLRGGKKTESGNLQTGDKILDGIRKNPKTSPQLRRAIEFVQEIREIRTLKSSFCDQMPSFIGADGRLHTKFKNTSTGTGRLSAEDPNMLALPKHSDRGKLIRGGFVARPRLGVGGRMIQTILGEWDLDQIEMRVMAIDACDERMIEEFLSGVDKHTATAASIFNKPIDQIDKEIERFAAKAVNFGILMGMTEFGLLDQFLKNGSYRGFEEVYNRITEELEQRRIEWTAGSCREVLDGWHRSYPQASRYQKNKHYECRRHGYVEDMWKRKRWLPDIDSDNPYFRAEAERQAQATPIQSGAQGIVKRWMIEVWKRLPKLWAQGIYVEPLLQVHDALVLEFDDDKYEPVNAMMHEALSELQMFAIPITAKGKTGLRLSDL